MTAPSPAHPPALGPPTPSTFSDSQSAAATQQTQTQTQRTQSSTLPSLARAPGLALALGESQPTQQAWSGSGIPGLGRLGQTRSAPPPAATADDDNDGTGPASLASAGAGGSHSAEWSVAGDWKPPSAFPGARSRMESSLQAGERWAPGATLSPKPSAAGACNKGTDARAAGSSSLDDGSQMSLPPAAQRPPPSLQASSAPPPPALVQPSLHAPSAADDAYTQVHYDRSYESSPTHSASLSNDEIEASLGWGSRAPPAQAESLIATQLATQSQSQNEDASMQEPGPEADEDPDAEGEDDDEELEDVGPAAQGPASVGSSGSASQKPGSTVARSLGPVPPAAAPAAVLVPASHPSSNGSGSAGSKSSLGRLSSSTSTVVNSSGAAKRTTPPPTPGRPRTSTPPPMSDDNATVPGTSSPGGVAALDCSSGSSSRVGSSASLRPHSSTVVGPTSSGLVEGALANAPPSPAPSPLARASPAEAERERTTTDNSVVPDSQLPDSAGGPPAGPSQLPPSTAAVPPASSAASTNAQASTSAAPASQQQQLPVLNLPPRDNDEDDDEDDYTFGSTYRKSTAVPAGSKRPSPASDDTVIPSTSRQVTPFASPRPALGASSSSSSHAPAQQHQHHPQTVNPSEVFDSLVDASSDLSDLSDDESGRNKTSRAARLYAQKTSSAKSSRAGSALGTPAGSSAALGPPAPATAGPGGAGSSARSSPSGGNTPVERLMKRQVALDMPVAGPSRPSRSARLPSSSRSAGMIYANESRVPDSQPAAADADDDNVEMEDAPHVDSLGPFTYVDETLAVRPPAPAAPGKGKGKRALSAVSSSSGGSGLAKKAKAADPPVAGPSKPTSAAAAAPTGKRKQSKFVGQGRDWRKGLNMTGEQLKSKQTLEQVQQEAPNWQPPSTASGSKKKTGAAAVKSEPDTVTASKSHKKRKSSVPEAPPPPPPKKSHKKQGPRYDPFKGKGREASAAPVATARSSIRGASSSPALSRRAAKATLLLSDSRTFHGIVDRVFALYRGNGTYYPATVVGVGSVGDPSDFRVAYDEGEDQLCHLKNLRRCAVRVGDVVWHDGEQYIVQQDADRPEGLDESDMVLVKLANSSSNSEQWHIKIGNLVIDQNDIGQLSDRKLEENDMVVRGCSTTFYSDQRQAEAEPTNVAAAVGAALAHPSPTRSRSGGLRSTSVTAPTSGASHVRGRLFAGKAFVTSNVSDWSAVSELVTAHGGQSVEDMPDFYRVEGTTAAGALPNGSYVGSHIKYVPVQRDIQGVFLLADSPARRPKAFKALALGVPMLVTSFIKDALEAQAAGEPTPLDWRAYKLATPDSCVTGQASSQSFIHNEWGSSHAIARNPLQSTPDSLPRPFAGLAMLYLNKNKSDRELIVFLALALGADSVAVAADELKAGELHRYDVVVVRDGEPVPAALEDVDPAVVGTRAVDEEFVKQVVLAGALVPFRFWKPAKDAMGNGDA